MTTVESLSRAPNWAIVLIGTCLLFCVLLAVAAKRSLAKARTGTIARHGHPQRHERVMLASALVPSVVVWLAVLSVSFIGLTGFARDIMNWHHWTNILVPLSLDGISVSFGGWAFVAVHRNRHPGRAYKIVLAAATLSATLNYVHGREKWSTWAGLYLAFLSLAGMTMFHEMLKQFMAQRDEHIDLHSRYPRFGQRWLYAPISTFRARRAWIVNPPPTSITPTVLHALAHSRAAHANQAETNTAAHAVTDSDRASRREAMGGPAGGEISPRRPSNGKAAQDLWQSVTDRRAIAGRRRTSTSDFMPTETPINRIARSAKEINRDAEQLWIEHAAAGLEMTGSQLLNAFQRHHNLSRSHRWASNRAAAARTYWERTQGAQNAANK